MVVANPDPAPTGFDVFLQMWDRLPLTATVARHVLKLSFSADEEARMHALMDKNNEGGITPAELQELDAYVRVWAGVSTLQSKARAFLNTQGDGGGRAWIGNSSRQSGHGPGTGASTAWSRAAGPSRRSTSIT